MRNRSQNVTGEKVRSQKGRKPAPDRQKEAGESPDKKGERIKLSQFVGAGPVPSPWPGGIVRVARVEWEPVAGLSGWCCPPPGCFKNRGG